MRVSFGSVTLVRDAYPEGDLRFSAADPGDDALIIHAVLKGNLDVSPEESAAVEAGSAFLVLQDRHSHILVGRATEVLSIVMPADVARGPGIDPESLHLVPIVSDLLAPAIDFMSRALTTARESSLVMYFLERIIQEMVVGLLIDSSRMTLVPKSPETVSVAMTLIAARCQDPALTASSLAQDLSISLRQLERLFAKRSTTVAREIRRARMQHAISLLSDRSYAALSIDQIAQYSGFANGSSLARAMASEGMSSPRKYRLNLDIE